MLDVRVESNAVRIGKHFAVDFQRTLRIPEDGGTYPLPPGLGRFPVFRVEDYAERVPESWRERGGVFIPMYQREALWLYFAVPQWRGCAVKVGVGKVNAVSGKRWHERLNRSRRRQDYVVCPDQPWLDGINAGNGYIRQFVAMALGQGYTVEGQLTGKEEWGGIQILVFEPKPGRFPDSPPESRRGLMRPGTVVDCCSLDAAMGLAPGGRMRQKIYRDEHGVDTWDLTRSGRVFVHIVNSAAFREITGMAPPPTPVSARTYTTHGLPWFDLYDDEKADVAPSKDLAGLKPTHELGEEKGLDPEADDDSLDVPADQLVSLGSAPVSDGEW